MLLPIKPIYDPKKMRKNGTGIIYLQYCYSHEKHPLLNTQIAIPPSDWNKKKLQVKDSIYPA
jgi:hypothetical protein